MAKRALISVSDKTGVETFARTLTELGYEILSTGGTQKTLAAAKIPVTPVETVTEFPECFGGRVKTMHPAIMGGILFRRDNADDVKEAKKLGIEPIDIVVVNLYPFGKTAADPEKSRAEVIEQIDIGGPTLLRSAAKNHSHVTVICDVADYGRVLAELEKGESSDELRDELATKAFFHTASYDTMISSWLSEGKNWGVLLRGGTALRYGENPHQWGKYFGMGKVEDPASWGKKLQGKDTSYLNILDADAAWSAVCEFEEPTAVFVKHANPSGIASRGNIEDAFQAAYDADRLSAFGVIIALNRECSKVIAQKVIDQKMFVEVIVAKSYEAGALEILSQKPNIRVIEQSMTPPKEQTTYRSVLGGMLMQNADTKIVTEAELTVVTKKKPTKEQIKDLLFAWKCVKYCKSNAIVFAHDLTTVGLGTGQTSRVDATWIAAKRAGEKSRGAVMASDAFFPFPDSVEEAAKHGISVIIQPGGSIRDAEVFAKAEELGLVMVTTGVRAFRH
ncbi:MAG: bifunctional phosphoribosylaminoimidazolecarboxamide formyltransferase/IMP cyclohydrolase [Candidatus Peribacteraceae bacterium]|nr:bifunctional phosphoribosylaminoimidazolecarboxamide formyltransferase/IMP cyclohydrolase [Candidatus Peribacteraceae bacterium]